MKKLNRVFQRVENDYQEFKAAMFAQDSAVVYENAYKISCIYEIYDILRDSYDFSCAEIATILDFKGNILEQIYDEWLHDDYSYHHNLLEDSASPAQTSTTSIPETADCMG